MRTTGLLLAVLLAAAPNPAPAEEKLRQVTAVEMDIAGPVLIVTDLQRSLRFYVDGLGMTVARELSGNPGPGAVLVPAGRTPPPHLLVRQRSQEPSTSPPVDVGNGLSRVMLSVADPSRLAARLKAAGYAPTAPSSAGVFFVKDPDGYNYEIIPRGAHRR
jgi:catechol 2,3-dioxygenase-like lactoylglutathione lyase family enzyme